MKIKLGLKPFKQESAEGCGAAALRSILDFFGKNMGEKEIMEAAGGVQKGEEHYGVLMIHMAAFAYRAGFFIHAYIYDMGLLKPEWERIGKEELAANLETLKAKFSSENKKTNEDIIDSILQLLKNNQDVKIKVPDKKDIIRFLEKGLPIMISVKAMLLEADSKIKPDVGHYVVVSGYDSEKETFSVVDPFYGNEYDVDEARLMLAWHINAIESSAYLLAFEAK